MIVVLILFICPYSEIKDPTIIPKPVLNLPCVCEPGQGLTQANKCTSCQAGTYSAGGDILDVWDNWSKNGTVPPRETGISVYCDTFRQYVAPCESWKASGNYSIFHYFIPSPVIDAR